MNIKSFIFCCIFLLFLTASLSSNALSDIKFKSKYNNYFTAENGNKYFSISNIQKNKNGIVQVQDKSSEVVEYPVVDMMESKVLGSKYPKEDIYKRLDKLETAVYGRISQKSLSDRVDDLSKSVLGDNDFNEEDNNVSSSNDDKYSSHDSYSSSEKVYSDDSEDDSGSGNLNNLLFDLEKKLLNQTYPNESTEERVSRLESFIFNKSSDEYPMDERIDRISSVVKATPSNEIYKDLAQLKNSQMLGQGLSLVALILMIVAGIAF